MIMRDVLMLPFSNDEMLVIASDNSGGIGEKEQDVVKVDYETLAYFSLRVAMMECMAVGANPIAIVMQNFIGDKEWKRLEKGINRLFQELHIPLLPITGSTESNFHMIQSAVGMIVIGRLHVSKRKYGITPDDARYAVIGEPLVGNEVLDRQEKIAPLSLFKQFVSNPNVYEVVPIGSKGVLYELKQLVNDPNVHVSSLVDLNKSAGPSTCFLISYNQKSENEIKEISKGYFHLINVKGAVR